MKYLKQIEEIKIPSYNPKQERFNVISHFLGIPLSLGIIIWATIIFIKGEVSPLLYSGLLIFSLSALLVYFFSSLYHFLNPTSFKKKIFRVVDHCTIFLLIAGTYTPICLFINQSNMIGLIMLLIEWVSALFGIILNAFFLRYRFTVIISLILYIAMGWLAIYSGGFIYMPRACFIFILLGGIIYSIGAILYAFGHKKAVFHSIFHIFVLVSTILQTVGIISLFI